MRSVLIGAATMTKTNAPEQDAEAPGSRGRRFSLFNAASQFSAVRYIAYYEDRRGIDDLKASYANNQPATSNKAFSKTCNSARTKTAASAWDSAANWDSSRPRRTTTIPRYEWPMLSSRRMASRCSTCCRRTEGPSRRPHRRGLADGPSACGCVRGAESGGPRLRRAKRDVATDRLFLTAAETHGRNRPHSAQDIHQKNKPGWIVHTLPAPTSCRWTCPTS
jgi:hypothetical protein